MCYNILATGAVTRLAPVCVEDSLCTLTIDSLMKPTSARPSKTGYRLPLRRTAHSPINKICAISVIRGTLCVVSIFTRKRIPFPPNTDAGRWKHLGFRAGHCWMRAWTSTALNTNLHPLHKLENMLHFYLW